MPTYEYQCSDCGHLFEQVQKMSDPTLKTCPACGKDSLRRLVSAPAFHLKGSGWYKTDYASSNTKTSNGSNAKSADAGASGTGSSGIGSSGAGSSGSGESGTGSSAAGKDAKAGSTNTASTSNGDSAAKASTKESTPTSS